MLARYNQIFSLAPVSFREDVSARMRACAHVRMRASFQSGAIGVIKEH